MTWHSTKLTHYESSSFSFKQHCNYLLRRRLQQRTIYKKKINARQLQPNFFVSWSSWEGAFDLQSFSHAASDPCCTIIYAWFFRLWWILSLRHYVSCHNAFIQHSVIMIKLWNSWWCSRGRCFSGRRNDTWALLWLTKHIQYIMCTNNIESSHVFCACSRKPSPQQAWAHHLSCLQKWGR